MKCKAFIYSFMLDSLFIKKNNVEYLFEYLWKNQVAQTQYLSHFFSGLDGSRTRVRNTIPCPSTSVVYYLTFPLPHDNKQPCGFSSFMIRPTAQSFADVVSYIVEAWVPKCRCSGSDCCQIRQRMLNYLQRLILIWPFNASPYDSLLQLHVPRRNLY